MGSISFTFVLYVRYFDIFSRIYFGLVCHFTFNIFFYYNKALNSEHIMWHLLSNFSSNMSRHSLKLHNSSTHCQRISCEQVSNTIPLSITPQYLDISCTPTQRQNLFHLICSIPIHLTVLLNILDKFKTIRFKYEMSNTKLPAPL